MVPPALDGRETKVQTPMRCSRPRRSEERGPVKDSASRQSLSLSARVTVIAGLRFFLFA